VDRDIATGTGNDQSATAMPPDARPTDPYGHLDGAGADGITGWAVDRARPGETVRLVAVHLGQVVAEGATGLPREDVVAAGLGVGQPGFCLKLPDGLARLGGARIAVHEAATGRELVQSPATIRGVVPGLGAEARDLVAALVGAEAEAACDPAQLDEAAAFLLTQFDRLFARRAALAQDAAEMRAAFARLVQGRGLSALLGDAARACLDRYPPLHLPPEPRPECSVVIPAHGQFAATYRCVESILRHLPRAAIEVIVVDDGSQDETVFAGAVLTGGVRIHRLARNEGFVAAANAGAALARGRTVMLLNNDTEVEEGWLDALLQTFGRDPSVGVAGAKLIGTDGRLQECGGLVWRDGGAWNWGRGCDADRPEYRYMREVDYVSGAAMMVAKALWDELGGFDLLFAPGYYEDTDLCFRARAAGRRVVVQPESRVIHHEGTTAGQDEAGAGMKRFQPVNRRHFQRRWEAELRRHPISGESTRAERGEHRPRALFVDTCVPTPDQDAGSVAAVEHMRSLMRLGCKVCFVASDCLEHSRHYTPALEREGIQCFDAPWYGSVEEVLRRERDAGFGLVYLHRLGNAAQFTPLIRQLMPGARIVYNVADLHHLRTERQAALDGSAELRARAVQLRAEELAAVRAADAVIVHSGHEAALLREAIPEAAVACVPWTVPARPAPRPFAQRSGLAFVGGYRHTPNVDAARFLVEEVMPLAWRQAPGIEVRLAGSNMPDAVRRLAGPLVRVVGQVADLDELLGDVRLTAAPLRYGAGLKGKVLASFAAGVPCAMTAMAAEGMALPKPLTRCIGDTAAALAAVIVSLHEDPARNRAAAAAGLAWVQQECSAARVDTLLAEACGLPPPRASSDRTGSPVG
jgi:GT2 family glycosyltransferase